MDVNANAGVNLPGWELPPAPLKDNPLLDMSKTPDEIKAAALKEARKTAMVSGEVYADTGVMVPFTSDDALALLQVKAAFEMGITSTVFVFSNGQKLPMTPDKFPAFAQWFAGKRNIFYTG